MNKLVKTLFLITFLSILFSFESCKEEYLYLKESPSWMGENIYATLQSDSRFTTYVKILGKIDPRYTDVLSKTGSRTIFVPTDSAFNVFFQNNPYGIRSVDDMSKAMMTTFVSFYTLENAYVSSFLGHSIGPVAGNCLRRYTMMSVYDSIPFVTRLPDNPQFAKFKNRAGMYLMTTGRWTMLNFIQSFFDVKGLKNEDFNLLYPGQNRVKGDKHIFDAKIIQSDITNTNGYIHVLNKVVIPPISMYEYIRDNDSLSIFRRLIERFCEPKYDATATATLHEHHPEVTDSVYTLSFFDSSARTITDELGYTFTVDPILYSPAANDNSSASLGVGKAPNDMPTIFVPDNNAMEAYFQDSYLSGYGSWDNVPDDIVAKVLNTHMKKSFLNSLPTQIDKVVDDAKGDELNLTWSNVEQANVCRNGVIYTINVVCLPRDFRTVVAPILKDSRTKILNWLINNNDNNFALKYNYYLTSLESGFTLLVPTDDAFMGYIDPVYYGTNIKVKYNFKYNDKNKTVFAVKCNMADDSIGVITDLALIRNRLSDILDLHIVSLPKGQENISSVGAYFETKGGASFKISRNGGNLKFQGSADVEKGEFANVIEQYGKINKIDNGTTYFIDKRLDQTLNSPYKIVQDTVNYPQFSKFNILLNQYNNPDVTFFKNRKTFSTAMTNAKLYEYIQPIFFKKEGIDYNIPFWGHFNYTLFVPSNTAIDAAIADGTMLSTAQILLLSTDALKIEAVKKVILLLKNQFVDYSVYTDNSNFNLTYATSAKNPVTKRFYKVTLGSKVSGLVINPGKANESGTIESWTNIMARQYRFSTDFKLASNSRVVIHMIDKMLTINQE